MDRADDHSTSTPPITQDMIQAYDEYTHLTLDRRSFMERLTKLAGSTAAAATIMPLLSANSARAAIVAPDDARVVSERVTYAGATGEMKALLVKPANAPAKLPAVIVIHENRGLNPHIEDVTRRMALEGFVALGVDFLSPAGGTPANEDTARDMIGKLNGAETTANAVATIAYLKGRADTNGKVGAIGFCWGGGLVNALAVASPDLGAGVSFYGRVAEAADVPRIKAKLMLHYASLDERINAGIPAFKAALDAAKTSYELHMYEGVNHAFHNDTSEARYNKAAAELAWSRTVAFLKANLS
jgi:carboxymethylenebutenolidase